jgi:hypothetical protein
MTQSSPATTPRVTLPQITEFFQEQPVSKITNEILESFAESLKELYPNLNTLSTTFSKLRKILRIRLSSKRFEEIKYIFSIGKENFYKRKELGEKALMDKTPFVITTDEYKKLLVKLSQSSNPYENMLAVTMAIGSRPAEILSEDVAEFEPVDKNHIRQIGVAKYRDSDKGRLVEIEKRIIKLTPNKIFTMIDNIRDKLETSTTPAVSDAMRRVAKKYGINFQQARDGYASVSFELYADKNKLTRNAWISKALGHSNGYTAINYNRTTIVPNTRAPE